MSSSTARLGRLMEAVDPRVDLIKRRTARRAIGSALRRRFGRGEPIAAEDPWHEPSVRRVRGVPPTWRDVRAPGSPSPWAVVLHDVGDDMALAFARLDLLGLAFDLFIVVDSAESSSPAVKPPAAARHVQFLPPVAGGADRALVSLVNAGLLSPYAVLLRATTAAHGILSSLDSSSVQGILDAFAADPGLGLVTDDRSCTTVQPNEVSAQAVSLLGRIELPVPAAPFRQASGVEFWARAFLVQGLRSLNLSHEDVVRPGRASRPGSEPLSELLGALTAEAGCSVVGLSDDALRAGTAKRPAAHDARATVIPFYLPQFHPIAENDQWWGAGFTEWSNVTAASPAYRHHYQPKLPQGLGFYDLRVDDARERQSQLARYHGVSGFMYYYYWFAGRRVLDQPIEALVAGTTDFPFCVMWANENWTRSWDGTSADVLLAQRYDEVSADALIDDLIPLMRDPRYVRIDGRAVVAVYRPAQIPDLSDVVAHWHRRARQAGVELYLLSVDVGARFDGLSTSPAEHGFDGHLGFPPHQHTYRPVRSAPLRPSRRFSGSLWDYHALVRDAEDKLRRGLDDDAYPTVMVNFDNTARRRAEADIFVGSNPYTFRRWLEAAVAAVEHRAPDHRLVFVNAWNEWAEGAILEPSTRFGATYLQAIRDVVGLQLGCSDA